MKKIDQFVIPIGSKLLIIGMSGVGKSQFMECLIKHRNHIFEPSKYRVVFVYKFEQPWFKNYKNIIEFSHETIPPDIDGQKATLLFIDDLLEEEFETIQGWFLRNCRHLKTTIIVNYQSLFNNSSAWRSITQNVDFLFLFYTARSAYQVSLLARQIFGCSEKAKQVVDLYHKCVAKPYKYLLFDLRPSVEYRLRSNILPNEEELEKIYEF
jgi:GTPase SAR1 family protein